MSLFELSGKSGKLVPWDKQVREKPEEFKYFHSYLVSKERRLDKLSQELNLQESYLKDLSRKNRWDERVAAYDVSQLEVTTALSVELLSSKESNVAHMTEKHLYIAQSAQEVGMVALKYLHECIKSQNSDEPKKPIITGEQIIKILDFGSRLERLTLGEATAITETKKTVDYSKLSNEELALFKQLAEKSRNKEDE